MNRLHTVSSPTMKSIRSSFGVAGLAFHNVPNHDYIIISRAILKAAQKICHPHSDDPTDFLIDALTRKAEEFVKNGWLSHDDFDQAIMPLMFFAGEYLAENTVAKNS
ncbi:hypothetical protein [Kiloniella antarctica]|uniref:Uncharacterized protein n=1 Tax=Kiloniella antarctica TaxID=1550907 RepID=A0ABW5BEZ3_9PROT